jgi:general stress protein YciG
MHLEIIQKKLIKKTMKKYFDISDRGFASMDPEKQREIASKGGKAAHERGTAHEFTSDEARDAGRKGGKSVSQNREHMSEIGRRGGQA